MNEGMEITVDQSVFLALIIVFVSVIFISGKWYLSYRKDKREAEAEKRKQTDGRAPDEMTEKEVETPTDEDDATSSDEHSYDGLSSRGQGENGATSSEEHSYDDLPSRSQGEDGEESHQPQNHHRHHQAVIVGCAPTEELDELKDPYLSIREQQSMSAGPGEVSTKSRNLSQDEMLISQKSSIEPRNYSDHPTAYNGNKDREKTASPPDYDDVVSQSSDKPEKYPVFQLDINGQTYSLEAMTPDYSPDDWIIPDKLMELITDICHDYGVRYPLVYQSPDDCKELLVVGKGATTKVQDVLQKAVSQSHFNSFTLFTENIEGILHSNELIGGPLHKFNVRNHIQSNTAVCELVMKGKVLDPLDPYTGYFAIVPAHFLLEKHECEELLAESVTPETLKRMKDKVNARIGRSTITMEMFNSSKKLELKFTSLLAYRHYRVEEAAPDHYKSYLNDLVLLKINPHQLLLDSDNLIPRSEIENAMTYIFTPTKVKCSMGEILPIQDPKMLAAMAMAKVRVRVGPANGYMVFGGSWQLSEKQRKKGVDPGRQFLHSIQFVVDDWPLINGHSGTIVYVIDAHNQCHYRLGMLVGHLYRTHRNGKAVFQAVVLSQALKEIEHENYDCVQNLQLLNQCETGDHSAGNLSLLCNESKTAFRCHQNQTSSSSRANEVDPPNIHLRRLHSEPYGVNAQSTSFIHRYGHRNATQNHHNRSRSVYSPRDASVHGEQGEYSLSFDSPDIDSAAAHGLNPLVASQNQSLLTLPQQCQASDESILGSISPSDKK